MAISKITSAMLTKLLNKSVKGLPDEPNLTKDEIQDKFVSPFLDQTNSLYAETNRIVEEANTEIAAITPIKMSDVSVGTWVSNSTHVGFGYRAAISVPGTTENSFAIVAFNIEEEGFDPTNYFNGCDTTTDYVFIYSKVNTAITLKSLVVIK